ncbi:MAG: mechanosensitive ion channel [Methanomassiliicoccales archaeon]|nr:mechanosensitive ion channel [Methanomassiliicoccales archaeon]
MQDYGWAILAIIALFTVSLYIWSYISKHFEKLKRKEGKYLDSDVVEFLDLVVKVVIIIVLVFFAIYVASLISPFFKEFVWESLLGYILDIILIIVVVLLAMLIVKILRRLSRRARIKSTTGETLHTSAVEFTSLFLSYVVYIISSIIVIIIALAMIPGIDPISALGDFLENNVAGIMSTIVIIIAIYFVVKLVEAILEDFKFRTKKFNPQAIDLFKVAIRYALYLIAFLTAIFSLLSLMGLPSVGLVLVAITFIFVCLGIALSYPTIRNVVSGLAIMDVSPFESGDRVRICGDLVGDVIERGLVFTKVKTLEGEIVDVPNSELFEDKIFNYTRSGTYGISVTFEVSYDISHSEVEKCVMTAAGQVSGVVAEPKPTVFALDIGENRIRYDVVAYTKDAASERKIRSDLIFKIQDVFQANGYMVLFD